MAYSEVGITNMALNFLGHKTPISSMDEDSTAAIAAKGFWDYIRDEVLEEFEWNWLKKRAALTQDSGTPVFGYDYQYVLPADYMRVISLDPEGIEYVIEGDYLLTDQDNTSEDVSILYLAKVTDVAKWKPSFVTAFAYRMAEALALRITGSTSIAEAMHALYERALERAKQRNQSEDYVADESGVTSWSEYER